MATQEKRPITQTPNNNFVNDATAGDVAWKIGPKTSSRIGTVDLTSGQTSQYLKLTKCGFSIPAGSTIEGITVSALVRDVQGTFTDCTDYEVQLVKGGVIVGDNKALATQIPAVPAYEIASYGGGTDLWGETWTADDINGQDFGFVYRGICTAATGPAKFRVGSGNVTITVTYS